MISNVSTPVSADPLFKLLTVSGVLSINSRTWENNVKVVNTAFNIDKKVSGNLVKTLELNKSKKRKSDLLLRSIN
jgi:hypothetical protein